MHDDQERLAELQRRVERLERSTSTMRFVAIALATLLVVGLLFALVPGLMPLLLFVLLCVVILAIPLLWITGTIAVLNKLMGTSRTPPRPDGESSMEYRV